MFKAAEAFLNTNKDFLIINIKFTSGVLTSPQCAALLHRPMITCEYSTHPAVEKKLNKKPKTTLQETLSRLCVRDRLWVQTLQSHSV